MAAINGHTKACSTAVGKEDKRRQARQAKKGYIPRRVVAPSRGSGSTSSVGVGVKRFARWSKVE